MKLLSQYYSVPEAEEASSILREKGILTHVSGKTSNTYRIITGAVKVGLWVVLDQQYSDACELLKNRDHRVSTGLTEQELKEIESKAGVIVPPLNLTKIANGAMLAIVIGLLVFILYRAL